MSEREKLTLLEELFEMEEGELTADMELKNIGEWDSMTMLSLIVLMQDEFGQKLTGAQIDAFQTVGDILEYMVQ